MSAIIATDSQNDQNEKKRKRDNKIPNITEFIYEFCRIFWTFWKVVNLI